jgi:TetR/AcrR family transcriptional repressor of nem operon
VPKGSFYNYFDSKEHFAMEVIRFCAARTIAELDEQLNDDEVEALDLIARCFDRQACHCESSKFREGCIFGNLAAEVAGTSEACRYAAAEAMAAMSGKYREVLERGQREGTVRSDVAASELAGLLVNAWEGAVLRMKVEKSKAPLKQVVELLMGRFFRPRR